MTNFESKQEIGELVQEKMYPYRKGMMLVLSMGSLLFAYILYLSQLFVMGDAHIIWLVFAVLISTSILMVTVRPVILLNRRLWMNSLLLVHLLIYFYGLLLASDINQPYSSGLTIIAVILVLLSIVLVYRTTIYDFPSKRQRLIKDTRRLHFINITTGIFIILVTLFFLWAFLLFSGRATLGFLTLLTPISGWILSYTLQMKLLANQQKAAAYAIVFIQTAVIVTGIVLWIIGL
ncbi:hypothetical protein [Sporosarcina highlanderae]|uniref:Uncharacterized protein n=1 Tax=Sporosarcina highlanderae TaxID=3035916 RepID=A0ABT8JTQ6_9BACL|nr:hypothetical protein [Sporosarcina highlanderae]MDN4608515.1 hypothetical protein [Sporosarcina highlanderae]